MHITEGQSPSEKAADGMSPPVRHPGKGKLWRRRQDQCLQGLGEVIQQSRGFRAVKHCALTLQ